MDITDKIKEVCPIYGISMPNAMDKQTWRIEYKPDATNEQKLQAATILSNYTVKSFDLQREDDEKDLDKIDIKFKAILLLIADINNIKKNDIRKLYKDKIEFIKSKKE